MPDVNINSSLSLDDLFNQLQQVRDETASLRDEVDDLTGAIRDGFGKSGNAVEDVQRIFDRLGVKIDQKQGSITKIRGELDKMAASGKNAFNDEQAKKLAGSLSELEEELKNLTKQKESLMDFFKDNAKMTDLLSKGFDLVKTKVGGFLAGLVAGVVIDYFTDKLADMWEELQGVDQAAVDAAKALGDFNRESERINSTLDGTNDRLAFLSKSFKLDYQIQYGSEGRSKAELESLHADFYFLNGAVKDLEAERDKAYNRMLDTFRKLQKVADNKDDRKYWEQFGNNVSDGREFYTKETQKFLKQYEQSQKDLSSIDADLIKKREEQALFEKRIKLQENVISEEDEKKRKAAAEKAKREADKRLAEEKRRLAEYEAMLKRITDLQNQLAMLQVQGMDPGRAKDVAEENVRFENAIRSLETMKAKARTSAAERELIDRIIEQQRINHLKRLAEIDKQYYREARAAYEAAMGMINDVILEGEQRELDAIERRFNTLILQLEDQAKKVRQSLSGLEIMGKSGIKIPLTAIYADTDITMQFTQLENARQKAIAENRKKWSLKRIDDQERLDVAIQEAIKRSGDTEVRLEKKKEIDKLRVQIEAAEKRIDLLKSSLLMEDRIIVAQMEAFITNAKKKIKQLQKDLDAFSLKGWLAKLLGLSDSDVTAAQTALESIKSMVDELGRLAESEAKRKVDSIQKRIDKMDEEIDKQKEVVNEQKRLDELGLANSLGIEQRRLSALEAAQKEEMRQKEEAQKQLVRIQKEQAKLRAASIAAQGLEQTTNLLTAATAIFKANSGIPIGGVLLAAAAVATMIASFAAVKSQLKAAQSDAYTSYKGGGTFDMLNGQPSHERGGVGVYNEQTGRKIAEFEGNEKLFIINKGSSAKYAALLRAINENRVDLSQWSVNRTGGIVPTGMRLDPVNEAIVNGTSSQPAALVKIKESSYLSEIAENTAALVKMEKEKPEIDDSNPDFRIEKRGNITRKIWKPGKKTAL